MRTGLEQEADQVVVLVGVEVAVRGVLAQVEAVKVGGGIGDANQLPVLALPGNVALEILKQRKICISASITQFISLGPRQRPKPQR